MPDDRARVGARVVRPCKCDRRGGLIGRMNPDGTAQVNWPDGQMTTELVIELDILTFQP